MLRILRYLVLSMAIVFLLREVRKLSNRLRRRQNQKLAAMATEGSVYGVDYAKGSVAASRAKNARSIEVGRVAIAQGTVSRLMFAGGSFDLVTSVETQYYWPDLPRDIQEIRRELLQPVMKVLSAAYSGR